MALNQKTVKDDMALLASYGWWMSRVPIGLKLKLIVTGELTNDGKKKHHNTLEIDKVNDAGKPIKLWKDADIETKQAFQKMLFPNGLHFNIKERKFGTNDLNPLFSIICNKKESCDGSNSQMVISAGVSLRLFAPRANPAGSFLVKIRNKKISS